MFCTQCGTDLPNSAKFCSSCGSAAAGAHLPVPAAQQWEYQELTYVFPESITVRTSEDHEMHSLFDQVIMTMEEFIEKKQAEGWQYNGPVPAHEFGGFTGPDGLLSMHIHLIKGAIEGRTSGTRVTASQDRRRKHTTISAVTVEFKRLVH